VHGGLIDAMSNELDLMRDEEGAEGHCWHKMACFVVIEPIGITSVELFK
jgi:hypothetical protein